MDGATKASVRKRAGDCCEYCRLPQEASHYTFHIEHVVARQHRGSDELDNLALACSRCNGFKGPNLTSVDPDSDEVVPLFHPRRDIWEQHFQMRGGEIVGTTPCGRATVELLLMNAPERVELRRQWLQQADDE